MPVSARPLGLLLALAAPTVWFALAAPAARAAPRDTVATESSRLAEGPAPVGLRATAASSRPSRDAVRVAVAAVTAPAPLASVPAVNAAADAARRVAMAHRFYPLSDAALVTAQTAVARRHFLGLTRQTRRYFPTIERALARHGLPDDLKYVAVIESALNPLAVSHAGAEGMWQFMPETQADFGLDSLSVRDPARATTAAALYLRRLGRMFDGDWQLALAAYNGGPGRVQRIARAYEAETGETATFWAIRERLPRETQAYVPRWIAVAELLGGPVERVSV